MSALLFAATIEPFQPERTAFAPESVIWLSQITPADTHHLQTPDGVFGMHNSAQLHRV